MKQKIIRCKNWCLTHKVKFYKYFVVGVSGVVADIGLLYIASDLIGIRPFNAILVTQIIVITFNFLLNKHWSFKSQGSHQKELIRYSIVMAWNYLFGALAMYVGNDILGINHLIIRTLTIAVAVAWNFLLYNYWVYSD